MYYINTNKTLNLFNSMVLFVIKSAICYVAIATVTFLRVKKTCYFHM